MVKADRAGMSAGLELREPLLDHELTAWCLRRPVEVRYDRATETSKLLPRRALERRLPASLVDRPKQGFTPPHASWLAGPLSSAVEDALARLGSGELEPLAFPPGCGSWADCDAALGDGRRHFLWRVVCFAEWWRHVRRGHGVDRARAGGQLAGA
jgi:asparagine synthase (glutamine-hydrolysing)